jgi:hypothetical protein
MLLDELAALDPSEMTGGCLAARGTHGGWDVLGEFADNDRKRARIDTNTKRKPAKTGWLSFSIRNDQEEVRITAPSNLSIGVEGVRVTRSLARLTILHKPERQWLPRWRSQHRQLPSWQSKPKPWHTPPRHRLGVPRPSG